MCPVLSQDAEIIVIGAGVAGLSLAAALAPTRRVCVLEREFQPGYHASGRSAACYSPALGNSTIQALSSASLPFLHTPPRALSARSFLHPRDILHIFIRDSAQHDEFVGRTACDSLRAISVREARRLWPPLREGHACSAVLEEGAGDLDVDAIMQGYRRVALANNARLHTDVEVRGIARQSGVWQLTTSQGELSSPLLVNAAGAWGDEVAGLAGVAPIGLQPMRRTALTLPVPAGLDAKDWPMVVQADAETPFYLRPDAGALLLSAADEEPSAPCDAQPEELAIATAIDRLQQAAGFEIKRVVRSWAGLRTFAPDRTFVAGFAPDADDFFFFVGQGGYGVQTSPALAQLAAGLIVGHDVAPNWCAIDPELAVALRPERFGA